MNAQYTYLWFQRLGSALQERLGLAPSVESRPIHLQLALSDNAWVAIGDASGPIGFDISTGSGELLGGSSYESKSYIGDDEDVLADELAKQILQVLWNNCEDVFDEVDGNLCINVAGEAITIDAHFCACRGFVPKKAGPCTNPNCGSDQ